MAKKQSDKKLDGVQESAPPTKRTPNYRANLKQRKFVEKLVAGENMYQAAIQSGYAHNTAIDARGNILESPRVKALMQNTMLSDDWVQCIMERLKEIITTGKHRDSLGAMDRWGWLSGYKQMVDQGKAPESKDRDKEYRDILKMLREREANTIDAPVHNTPPTEEEKS